MYLLATIECTLDLNSVGMPVEIDSWLVGPLAQVSIEAKFLARWMCLDFVEAVAEMKTGNDCLVVAREIITKTTWV